MPTPKNEFTHAIAKGQTQIGIWVSMASGAAAEIVKGARYDWVTIDMEHSLNDLASVRDQLSVFENSGTTSLVRVPWNEPIIVKQLLDMGAPGIVFPMIQTVEEAKAAIASTRYPPHGIRGVAGTTRATDYGRHKDYYEVIDGEITRILQIETLAAIDIADQIGAVDGVSGVFFGPADIGADMGIFGNPMDERIWAKIRPAAKALQKAGIPVGTLVGDQSFAAELLNNEFTYVAVGIDTGVLARGLDNNLALVKDKLK